MEIKDGQKKGMYKSIAGFIAQRKNIQILKVSFPDEENRNSENVDVLLKHENGEIVIEHTRIESYPKQIDDWKQVGKLLDPLRKELQGRLPSGNYDICVDIFAVRGAKKTKEIQDALIKWIIEKAPSIKVGPPDTAPEHCVREKPDGVPFEVNLCRWPGEDGKIFIMESAPEDRVLQELRRKKIKEALDKKCPKLLEAKKKCKKGNSILLFELNDISLGNHLSVSKALQDEIVDRIDEPDEIYLIETNIEPWVLWILKEGSTFFPEIQGYGPYYLDNNQIEVLIMYIEKFI